MSTGLTPMEKRALFISDRTLDWLPAVIVRGEGIFFEFSSDALTEWYESNYRELEERESLLTAAKAQRERSSTDLIVPVTAKKVLIHTFAHVLINELIFHCGYGSASLRERIYCSDTTDPEMNAVLIYTAAGDTEGSMGGLVNMGSSSRLPEVIENAIMRASWCSADPTCIESRGQGPRASESGGLSLLRSFLPETSCEEMNNSLDRAMLVGTLENPELGFFKDLVLGRF